MPVFAWKPKRRGRLFAHKLNIKVDPGQILGLQTKAACHTLSGWFIKGYKFDGYWNSLPPLISAALPRSLRAPFLASLGVVLLGSCQPNRQGAGATAAVAPPSPPLIGGKILSRNRRFVYAVRWYAPDAATATQDTVTMTAAGIPFDITPPEVLISWLFRPDTLWPAGPRQGVGATENQEEFWVHPPRYGRYRLLELNPFPQVKLPATSGRTWEWSVYPPGVLFGDPAWATWHDTIRVQFRYALGGTVPLATPLGNLPCSRIQATGHCKFGTTTLESYFHPAYGFVRLNYRNLDRSRTELEMVAVDVRPEATEKTLEQLLPKWGAVQPIK